jgi:hypothetical protein
MSFKRDKSEVSYGFNNTTGNHKPTRARLAQPSRQIINASQGSVTALSGLQPPEEQAYLKWFRGSINGTFPHLLINNRGIHGRFDNAEPILRQQLNAYIPRIQNVNPTSEPKLMNPTSEPKHLNPKLLNSNF